MQLQNDAPMKHSMLQPGYSPCIACCLGRITKVCTHVISLIAARYWRRFKYPVVVKQVGITPGVVRGTADPSYLWRVNTPLCTVDCGGHSLNVYDVISPVLFHLARIHCLQNAPVTHIDFNPTAPHDYAVTAGTRITLYDGKTNKEKRVLSKFKETVYSGVYRHDGKLLACGGMKPVVSVVDAKSRAVLRTYSGHTAPIHTTRFAPDGVHLLSGSDDRSVRYWDMPTATAVTVIEDAHDDYIRCSAVGGAGTGSLSGAVWATGSYDHTVRLWDSRVLRGQSGGSGAGSAVGSDDEDDRDEDEDDIDEEEDGADGEDKEDGAAAAGASSGSSSSSSSSSDDDSDDEDDDDDELDEEDSANNNDNEDVDTSVFPSDGGGGSNAAALAASSSSSQRKQRPGCVLTVDHGEPVTQVTILPGGGTLLTAGSNTCKLWDIISGGKLIHTFSAHQKLITSLCLDGTQTRLLSGGLDGLVKVYELGTFNVSHHMRYPSPILSMGCAPDNSRLVIGTTDGNMHVKQRLVKMGEVLQEQKAAAVLRSGSYRYFLRGGGRGNEATVDDISTGQDRKPKLKSYDKHMKAFEYGAALDAGLAASAPVITASVLEELVARQALGFALAGRDESQLEPLLTFLMKHISHPRYARLCVDVAHVVTDLFAPLLGTSQPLAALFSKLQVRLREELQTDKELLGLQGALDLLMAASSSGNSSAGY